MTDQEIAADDLKTYNRLMLIPEPFDSCLAIEKSWGLDGLPPAAVTAILYDVSMGTNLDVAFRREVEGS